MTKLLPPAFSLLKLNGRCLTALAELDTEFRPRDFPGPKGSRRDLMNRLTKNGLVAALGNGHYSVIEASFAEAARKAIKACPMLPRALRKDISLRILASLPHPSSLPPVQQVAGRRGFLSRQNAISDLLVTGLVDDRGQGRYDWGQAAPNEVRDLVHAARELLARRCPGDCFFVRGIEACYRTRLPFTRPPADRTIRAPKVDRHGIVFRGVRNIDALDCHVILLIGDAGRGWDEPSPPLDPRHLAEALHPAVVSHGSLRQRLEFYGLGNQYLNVVEALMSTDRNSGLRPSGEQLTSPWIET